MNSKMYDGRNNFQFVHFEEDEVVLLTDPDSEEEL